ncbi:MAG: hypothetical protein JJU16_10815 [Alkalibacterium sp.]|nr:hypothetical protein [Alkalibacterium sp.]
MFKRFKIECILPVAILFLAGCNEPEGQTDSDTHTAEESVQFIVSQTLSPTELTIVSGEETVEVVYQDEQWQSEELDVADERAIAFFIEDLIGLKGTRITEEPASTESLTIKLGNAEDTIDIKVWDTDSDKGVQVNNTMYKVNELPDTLSPFNKVFLEPALIIGNDSFEKITFKDEDELTLDQTTGMLEVETLPFISGWYLHGPYETDLSIEYTWMGQLLESFARLHGIETENEIEDATQTIEIAGAQNGETLEIGDSDETGFSLLKVVSVNQHYLVPTQLLERYQFDPLAVVDNFVALIPLDAVETVKIEGQTDQFMIDVEREFSLDEDDDVIVEHTFYFNNKEIEEGIMRRAYQYLARLSYFSEITEEDQKSPGDRDLITLTYGYINEGEPVERVIKLYPTLDSGTYIVDNDGVEEFTLTDEKLNDLFEAFRELE